MPEFARTLADMLTAAGCVVGWRTDSGDRDALRRHLERMPAARLVDAACRAWNPSDPPCTVRYLIRVWDALPDIPADAPAAPAPVRAADHQQRSTDDMFARALERSRSAAEEAAGHDAQKALIA